jgi:hypothetical protein
VEDPLSSSTTRNDDIQGTAADESNVSGMTVIGRSSSLLEHFVSWTIQRQANEKELCASGRHEVLIRYDIGRRCYQSVGSHTRLQGEAGTMGQRLYSNESGK